MRSSFWSFRWAHSIAERNQPGVAYWPSGLCRCLLFLCSLASGHCLHSAFRLGLLKATCGLCRPCFASQHNCSDGLIALQKSAVGHFLSMHIVCVALPCHEPKKFAQPHLFCSTALPMNCRPCCSIALCSALVHLPQPSYLQHTPVLLGTFPDSSFDDACRMPLHSLPLAGKAVLPGPSAVSSAALILSGQAAGTGSGRCSLALCKARLSQHAHALLGLLQSWQQFSLAVPEGGRHLSGWQLCRRPSSACAC